MRGTATARLAEAVNEIGNLLTAAKWPTLAVNYPPNGVKLYDAKEIYKDLAYATTDISNQVSDLKDCVNELCLKCGQYRTEHLGSCDGCRWKRVKEEVRR